MASIVYASSSKKIWSDFKERFDKSNLTRIFHLWKEISVLTQGTETVTSYYSRMRDLWDEMDAMVHSPPCDCEESSSHVEHVKQQRLLQFLVGLNESYAQVRSYILLSSSIPSENQAYAMAIQEESQRKLGQSEGGKEPFTMMVGKGNQSYNFNNQNQINNKGNQSYNFNNQNQINNNNFQAKKTQGHTKDNCYRIVGFPADFKSKRKVSVNEAYANTSTSLESNKGEAETPRSESLSQIYFPGGYFTKE
ncbi:hypothetical protein KY284_025091 [Solanum tuberosum]|nr:hypothetical protein KY284_025091 [Solanum tuberosum]